MKLGFTTQVSDYQVATPVYEGPLDLLLQLIEHAELDISKLALALVTDQYLSHLHGLKEQAADEVSAFLVIAARLLQIKSESLLPRPPVREAGEEDPGEALARQLLTYKRFKQIAEWMQARQMAGLRTYLRLAPPPKVQGKLDLSEFTLADIVEAARQAFSQTDQRSPLGTVVTIPRITILEKISVIVNSLRKQPRLSFLALLGKERSRLDVVVTFLAMLELVKRHFIRAEQDKLFDDIMLEPAETWDDSLEFDLEFGE